ncbi:FTR1 family protein [Gordonia sp. X0973]|uniref:iron uptake transporter permease EfeU n=1 Tax=Gordonia sp. X0973 TaxID=2742602 RepID=UPI000F51EEA7|nr:iron uptake transporter permease EfeU [Gordonia sp. X0973]QKT06537.1 FTR1 family protein [Gordonia sp. X0973]
MHSLVLAEPATSVVTQLTGSGVIGLREGLETGIVVMILVAFLVKSDRRDSLKYVWLGVGAALTLLVAVFLGIQFGTSTIDSKYAELVAGIASLFAVVIVTYMLLWMSKASAHLSGDLKAGMADALVAGPLAVFVLAFLAVGREGLETALLMAGYAESVAGGTIPLLGLLLGIAVAVAITVGLYYGAVRINFKVFFTLTGTFLVFVAAGILAYGVGALESYGWLDAIPGHGHFAFQLTGFHKDTWYGSILAGVFNFRPDPTWLQVVAWAAYIAIVLPIFLRRQLRGAKKPAATDHTTASEALTTEGNNND